MLLQEFFTNIFIEKFVLFRQGKSNFLQAYQNSLSRDTLNLYGQMWKYPKTCLLNGS